MNLICNLITYICDTNGTETSVEFGISTWVLMMQSPKLSNHLINCPTSCLVLLFLKKIKSQYEQERAKKKKMQTFFTLDPDQVNQTTGVKVDEQIYFPLSNKSTEHTWANRLGQQCR